MSEGVGLGQVGPVGVPVEGDPPDSQPPADVVDVIGGGGRSVGGETRAEAPGALGHRDPIGRPPTLGVRAGHQARTAGTPHVHKQQVAAAQQPGEQVDVGLGAPLR